MCITTKDSHQRNVSQRHMVDQILRLILLPEIRLMQRGHQKRCGATNAEGKHLTRRPLHLRHVLEARLVETTNARHVLHAVLLRDITESPRLQGCVDSCE